VKRGVKKMAGEVPALLTPEELAGRYAVAKSTILEWFRQGRIPAEVAVGKVIRFDPERVAEALRDAAEARRVDPEIERKMVGVI
jgi:excisionase family DNA binding protein